MQIAAFEQATLEQLVSYKAKDENDIQRLLNCEKLKHEAIQLCKKWNDQRKARRLKPWI